MLYFDYFQEDSLRGGDKLLSVLGQSGLDAQFLGCQQQMLPRDGHRLHQGRRLRVILRPTYVPGYKDCCGMSILPVGTDELRSEPLSLPAGRCCQVPGSFSHPLSCLLQPTELSCFPLTVAKQHQVAQMSRHGCHHLLHGRRPDRPMMQQGRHAAAERCLFGQDEKPRPLWPHSAWDLHY